MTGGNITENGHGGLWITKETYGGGVYVEDGGFFSQSGDAQITGNRGNPADIVYNDPDTTISYTVKHFFQNGDGEYIENTSLEQKMEGSYGSAANPRLTNAKPYSISGYKNQTIEQQALYKNVETVVSVYYDISIYYTLDIPPTLVIAEDTKTGSLTITPIELWILDTGKVVVSVESQYEFNLSYEGDDSVRISYELENDAGIINQGDYVADFTLANQDAVVLSAKLTGHPPYVGTYNDTLTFTIDYI